MIRFEHVNKSFGNEQVLIDFNLEIPEGEFLTVIGRSGCGKTTMLRMINGLHTPDSGRVLVQEKNVAETDLITLRRSIGYVIQNKGLFPHMTVSENITYVPCGASAKDSRASGRDGRSLSVGAFRRTAAESGHCKSTCGRRKDFING